MNGQARRRLLYWGGWTLLGVYMASADAALYPKAFFWRHLLPMNLLQNLCWGLAGLGVLRLARRFPLEGLSGREWRRWMLHLGASVVLSGLGLVAVWLVSVAFLSPTERIWVLQHPSKSFFRFFAMYFHFNLLIMWAVLGGFHGWRIHQKFRERELEATQLATRLTQAQNQALRMQLQPHFLFNTLNSISALIHSDPESADRMLTRLADLLRMTLDSGSSQEIPLRQELAFVEAYLAIEAVRFHDRLRVRIQVPVDCQEARVPAFLLQPIVENAIKHGVSGLAGGANIEIRARKEGEWLDLEIEDDGRGFERGREGIGTTNTAARLQLLYRERHRFTISSAPGQGTRVLLRVPWQGGSD
ncbi:MAG: histidine kinase [Acidobacteria bacterium]|nr:histidine kinase [Acidobacteriota bacterium]